MKNYDFLTQIFIFLASMGSISYSVFSESDVEKIKRGALIAKFLGGTVVWSRSDIGTYGISSEDLFIAGKTYVVCGSEYIFNPVLLSTSVMDTSNIIMSVYDVPNRLFMDNVLVTTSIEIRVYN